MLVYDPTISDLMALWIVVNDINTFTEELCYWQNKLKSAGGAPLLHVFWKAQVEGISLCYSCFLCGHLSLVFSFHGQWQDCNGSNRWN